MATSGCDQCTKRRSSTSCHAHSTTHTASYLWHVVISCLAVTCLVQPSACLIDRSSECDSGTQLYAEDLDLKLYQDSASIPSYYRYLTIDVESKYLFVGAMNRIYGFYLNNIALESKMFKQHFGPIQDSLLKCKISGQGENFECQNHIRYLVRNKTVPDTFYMCSTGSYTAPKAYQLKFRHNKFITLNENLSGTGICPYDPADNFTAILVDNGTPGGIPSLFAGTYTDSIKSHPIFWRPDIYNDAGALVASHLRNYKNSWLNEPQFVGSFDVGDSIFIFFREVALEYTNCGKKVYSRIAKVCKNDMGGRHNLIKTTWTSFVKARLNCSIPGEYPYYFDEIQDVIQVGNNFYALFTTNINGLTASAICVYNMKDLKDRGFSGKFKEQRDEHSKWLPVRDAETPNPRPGNCSARRAGRDDEPALINLLLRTTMLMDKAVSHKFGRPIFYKSDVLMQKLVGVQNVAGLNEIVFFTATNTGLIYKIAAWPGLTSLDTPKTYLVSTYIPFRDNRPIWSLKMHDNWIYFGTDMAVGQIGVETCQQYNKIDLCIYDPYCGWDRVLRECHSNKRPGLINYKGIDLLSYSLEEAIEKQVKNLYSFERVSKFSGSSANLAVEYLLHIPGSVQWTVNGSRVVGKRHHLAKDNSLIITDLRKADEGVYQAVDEQGRTVSKYALSVETNKEQIEQRWIQKFDQWCDEFERYQEDIRQWERKCESCCQTSAMIDMMPDMGDGK